MTELSSFDRVAHCYDETRGLPPEASRAIGDGIAAIVREVSASTRLLEIGIGTGRMAVPLAAAGVRVAGIDISPKMLAVLREKRGDVDVMLAEASHPPLRARSFDALLFVHILHLVPDAEVTLRATLPLVRPGGVVLYGGDAGGYGGDRLRAQANEIIRDATHKLAGIALTDRDLHDAARELADRIVGETAVSVRRVVLTRWQSHTNGRRMLDRLATRAYSGTWLIPEEHLPAIIERVTPQIDALYGGLDRDVEFERSFEVTVALLPG